ncbi:MAG TPA: methyltransferase domain-containing protein [Longimicrobium sp.]
MADRNGAEGGDEPLSVQDIKGTYERGGNVMALFRELEGADHNSLRAIQTSYDLQAGSYIRRLERDPAYDDLMERYTASVARLLDGLGPASLMEAGVGEATILGKVVTKLARRPETVLGFDISWSRVAYGRRHARGRGLRPHLFLGDLSRIPLEDGSVDVVYTSHSIEPNRGREREMITELHRVARRWLVLLEPSNELGSEETRAHIEKHRYCTDLGRHARELGLDVVEHRLFDFCHAAHNQTALLVIRKGGGDAAPAEGGPRYACPHCRGPLTHAKGNYYCPADLTVFPVVDGVPCLLAGHGILASKYLEDFGEGP